MVTKRNNLQYKKSCERYNGSKKGGDTMFNMFLYAVGVMYTPGPINILGLNQGIHKKFKASVGFFAGVGLAMFILFLIFGYTGENVIKKTHLIYISIVGSGYILYLAMKIFKASIQINEETPAKQLSFKDGLLMQLFNPKAMLATLPIATIHFPANEITGVAILPASAVLALMACLAPCTYALISMRFSAYVHNDRILKYFNTGMAILLAYVAFTIFKAHVFDVIAGVNTF
jgi:threonine/homoserine/homoserine lactone efflux protein